MSVKKLKHAVRQSNALRFWAVEPDAKALPAPQGESERVIDVPTGDIVPPGEQSWHPRNMAPPLRQLPPKPVIEAKAEPVPPSGSWRGPQDGPPPWLRRVIASPSRSPRRRMASTSSMVC